MSAPLFYCYYYGQLPLLPSGLVLCLKLKIIIRMIKIIMITEASKFKIDCVLMFLEWHLVF